MGKSSGSAPSAPDPYATADAQQKAFNNSAQYNAALNNVNSSGPLGSRSYQITGTDPATGAPIYSMTQGLSSGLQNILNNAYSAAGHTLDPAGINQKAAQAAYDSNMSLIAPQQQQQTEALRSQLAAQGITDPNSEAYQQATGNLSRQQAWQNNNLANQSTLTGIQAGNTAFNQNQAAQQQAIANFTGLNSQNLASQAGNSNYNTSPANIAQLMQNQYNAQLAGYNANQASNNNMMGGLFGLGAAALMSPVGTFAALSDIRAKTDIKQVGMTDGGLPIYTYKYKGDHVTHMGVMAQDVEKVRPDAVVPHPSGLKMVDYSKVQ